MKITVDLSYTQQASLVWWLSERGYDRLKFNGMDVVKHHESHTVHHLLSAVLHEISEAHAACVAEELEQERIRMEARLNGSV